MIDEKNYSYDSMLYRFRSDSEYNFDALLKNEMYASTPNILNDPLDCPITFNLDVLCMKLLKRSSFIRNHEKSILSFALEKRNLFNLEGDKIYNDYFNFQENNTKLDYKYALIIKDYILSLAKRIIYEVRECFGIVSFSLTCDNSVMWSHYASNYKGFVLKYNLLSLNNFMSTWAI